MRRARLSLAGRVALVTGAARGIGLATARALRARGARLALLDRDGAELEQQAGLLEAWWEPADVTDPDGLGAAVATLADRAGGLDVVVANAGIEPRQATLLAADPDDFQRVLDVNLNGVWRTAKAALPWVVDRQGHVLLNASMYAFLALPTGAAYAVSKAGVEQLGRALRIELAPYGASAGVAYFGFIDTGLAHRALGDPLSRRLREAMPAWVTQIVPVERAAEAIADGVERRAARVAVPRWVAGLQLARGLMGPLDERLARDARVQGAIRDADRGATALGPSGPRR